MSVSEAAELVCISKPAMYALIREGTIPSVHAGIKIVIHRQALIDWLSNSKGESNGEGSIKKRDDVGWEARYLDERRKRHAVYGKTQTEVRKKFAEAFAQSGAETDDAADD